MASGRITSAGDPFGFGFKIHIDWKEEDFDTNSSKVSATLSIEIPGHTVANADKIAWMKINGAGISTENYKLGDKNAGTYTIIDYKDVTVNRDSSGNANCTFEAYFDLSLTAPGYRGSNKINSFSIPKTTRALSKIDRTAPTVSAVQIKSITANSFFIEATASHSGGVKSNYFTVNGVRYNTGGTTKISQTVQGLKPDTIYDATVCFTANNGIETKKAASSVRTLPQYLTGITCTAPGKMNEGDEYLLKPVLAPSNATNKAIVFESSNPQILSVDKDGRIKALSKGYAKITIKARDVNNVSCGYEILVIRPVTGLEILEPVLYFDLADDEERVKTISYRVIPEGASDPNLNFTAKSGDSPYTDVDISAAGKISVEKEGEFQVVISAGENGQFKQTVQCIVTGNFVWYDLDYINEYLNYYDVKKVRNNLSYVCKRMNDNGYEISAMESVPLKEGYKTPVASVLPSINQVEEIIQNIIENMDFVTDIYGTHTDQPDGISCEYEKPDSKKQYAADVLPLHENVDMWIDFCREFTPIMSDPQYYVLLSKNNNGENEYIELRDKDGYRLVAMDKSLDIKEDSPVE